MKAAQVCLLSVSAPEGLWPRCDFIRGIVFFFPNLATKLPHRCLNIAGKTELCGHFRRQSSEQEIGSTRREWVFLSESLAGAGREANGLVFFRERVLY